MARLLDWLIGRRFPPPRPPEAWLVEVRLRHVATTPLQNARDRTQVSRLIGSQRVQTARRWGDERHVEFFFESPTSSEEVRLSRDGRMA